MSKKRVLTDYFKPAAKTRDDGSNAETLKNENKQLQTDSSSLPLLTRSSSTVTTMIPDSEGEEDSDDSLGEVITVWNKPKMTMGSSNKGKSTSKRQMPIVKKKEPTYTFSLATLVAQKLEDDDRDQAFQRIEARIAQANDDHVEKDLAGPTTKGVVEAAVGGDEGGKLMDMLNRREAWRADRVWHFFQNGYAPTRRPFPNEQWLNIKDANSRHQMLLTGYLRDMAIIGVQPPDKVLSWMLDELCVETREDVIIAYEKTLETYPSQLSRILSEGQSDNSSSKIANLFQILGGTADAVDVSQQIILQETHGKGVYLAQKRNIEAIVTLFRNLADYLPESVLQKICGILIRLRIDVHISRCIDLVLAVEESLSSCIASFSQESWPLSCLGISKAIISTFTISTARIRLLKSLPVDSARTHLFRRRLALTFLFENPEYLERDHQILLNLIDVVSQLEKPQFEISHVTDYGELKTQLEILDIAIDDGPSRALPGNHNLAIETLVNKLKLMSTNIVDGTMTSLLRTEAKQVLDNLQFRLTYSLERLGKMGQSVLEQHFMNDRSDEKLKQSRLSF